MPHVAVSKNGDTLRLDLKESSYSMKNVTLEAEVTMPKLAAVNFSGASRGEVTGFESSEPFYADLSGASELSGQIVAGDTTFELSGASQATLVASAAKLDLAFIR